MTGATDKAVKLPITVKVVYSAGAYNTGAVIGLRASSTSSAEAAADRLVDKLVDRLKLKPGQLCAKPAPAKDCSVGMTMWLIDANGGAS